MKISKLALVDTNVLIYASFKNAPQHKAANILCQRMLTGKPAFCLASQILLEFYSTVTNPKRVVKARTPREAIVDQWGSSNFYL